MSDRGLVYYKLVSPYKDDFTANCKLTINQIDQNFLNLKNADIKDATFVREDECKAEGKLIITTNDDAKIIVDINTDTGHCKNLTYEFVASEEDYQKGKTLRLSYKDDEGEHNLVIENIITADNLVDVIGHDILTKVISDSSLKGIGTMKAPLGLAGVEKTGMLAPADKVLDLTDGSELPKNAKYQTRFVTKEYVNDYGYLYNGEGVKKIQEILDNEYEREEIKKEVGDRENYWRVPSKADWDALLDSIEPCNYRNHTSAQCHIELGKLAGKYLKSECGWVNSEYECTCTGKRPYTGCTTVDETPTEDYPFDWDEVNDIPNEVEINPVGTDNFGMTILPSGVSTFVRGTQRSEGFKETTAFWTTTDLGLGQDTYVKVFDYDKSGVYQVAECPDPYYSVRLVKNYNGSNYRDAEYINGVMYKAILFPQSGQIWLASNFADKKGFVTIDNLDESNKTPEVLVPNNGNLPNEKRIEMFINEFNGTYWEKKVMEEGTTIVIENPCFDKTSGDTTIVCWVDGEGIERCIEVEIPKVSQTNIEYRVYLSDDGCDKVLKNTDDLVVERVLHIIVPMIDEERYERERADEMLCRRISNERMERIEADRFISGAVDTLREDLDAEIARAISAETMLDEKIEAEIERAISAETILDEKIEAETARAISAETMLDEKIEAEIERAISAETMLDEKIEAETERATAREDEIEEELFEEIERAKAAEDEISGQTIDTSEDYTLSTAVEKDEYNLVLKSKDGIDEHFVKIKFDADFGEI